MTCPGTLSWHHSVAEFQRHKGLPNGSLSSLEKPGLLCSIASPLRSATDFPMWTPPPALPASSLSPGYLKLCVLILLLQAPTHRRPLVPSEVSSQRYSDASSALAVLGTLLLEPPYRTSFTLKILLNERLGMMFYHCHFYKGVQACSGATRVETHTLVPLTRQSTAALLNGIFCNRAGRLSSNLAVCFYQP